MLEEKRWIITFSNGFCDCEIEEEFIGTYSKAQDFANKYLHDFVESYMPAAFGLDGEYSEEEFEDCLENCYYEIKEREDKYND